MAAREAAPPDVTGKPAETAAAGPATEMTATAAAAGATGSAMKSPLEKPLCELTDEDIAQVTREDCRRFLKEKGMRRPSWNKSQAIQQVISLKALLEGRHDADDDAFCTTATAAAPAFFARRPPDPPLQLAAPQVSAPPLLGSPPPLARGEPAAAEPQIAPAGCLPSPCQRRDPAAPGFPGADAGYRFPAAHGDGLLPPNTTGLPPRATAADGESPPGQLTIFYDGRVNVFDGVSSEKARVIMQIAAIPSCYDLPPLPPASPLQSRPLQCHELAQPPPPLPGRPLQCHELAQQPPSPAAGSGGCFRPPPAPVPALASPSAPPVVYPHIPQSSGRFPLHFRESMEEWRVPREVEPEGPNSRAASLQRYLEKRKDRFKCKKPVGSSSGMEMYSSQKMRDQTPNGQVSCSGMRSPTQVPRPPQIPSRCNSIENPAQNLCMSIDLNDDDIQEG